MIRQVREKDQNKICSNNRERDPRLAHGLTILRRTEGTYSPRRKARTKRSVAKAPGAPLISCKSSCCETQSLSSLSIDLICSRNSGAFLCPWAETACCTAASSTSSSVPEIFSEQFFSLGSSLQSIDFLFAIPTFCYFLVFF